MTQTQETRREVTVDMLGAQSLKDWNTLQNVQDGESEGVELPGCVYIKNCPVNGEDKFFMFTDEGRNEGEFEGSRILGAILGKNNDLNQEWLENFTWPEQSRKVNFPTDTQKLTDYLYGDRRYHILFSEDSTIHFDGNYKWTYLGNGLDWAGGDDDGVFLVTYDGKHFTGDMVEVAMSVATYNRNK